MVTTNLRADAHLRPPHWEVSSPIRSFFCCNIMGEGRSLNLTPVSQEIHAERVGDSNGNVWGVWTEKRYFGVPHLWYRGWYYFRPVPRISSTLAGVCPSLSMYTSAEGKVGFPSMV
jgi:hypothetical protein